MSRLHPFFYLVFTFFYSSLFYGQQVISGYLLDESIQQPIPFANIAVSEKPVGTTSNADGYFELKLHGVVPRTVIVISALGYKTQTFSAEKWPLDTPKTILLEPHIYNLQTVTIKATPLWTDGKDIVKEAVKRIPVNYANTPHVLQGFYRQAHFEDNECLRLVEAALQMHDPGIDHKATSIQSHVLEVKKSYDNRGYDKKTIANTIRGFYHNDEYKTTTYEEQKVLLDQYSHPLTQIHYNKIRDFNHNKDNKAVNALNENFIRRHSFKLDTVVYYNDELMYKVKFFPKGSGRRSSYWGSTYLPLGYLYIRTNDFGIFEMEHVMLRNPRKNDFKGIKVMGKGGIKSKIVIRFKEYVGKLYLSNFHMYYRDVKFLFSFHNNEKREKSAYTKGYFFIEKDFVVTEIIPVQSDTIEFSQWNDDLYAPRPYNEVFWEKHNVWPETAAFKKMREDLEQKVKLQEQYHENAAEN